MALSRTTVPSAFVDNVRKLSIKYLLRYFSTSSSSKQLIWSCVSCMPMASQVCFNCPTWIVRTINKVLIKAIKCLDLNIFSVLSYCLQWKRSACLFDLVWSSKLTSIYFISRSIIPRSPTWIRNTIEIISSNCWAVCEAIKYSENSAKPEVHFEPNWGEIVFGIFVPNITLLVAETNLSPLLFLQLRTYLWAN